MITTFAAFAVIVGGILLVLARLLHGRLSSKELWQIVSCGAIFTLFGPVGEVAVGSFYTAIFGHHLWDYQLWPVHDGYTSLIAPFIWFLGGMELAIMLHFIRRVRSKLLHVVWVTIDILVFELVLNIGFWMISGERLFYYTPSDLGHFSSLQTLPFYAVAAVVAMKSIDVTKDHRKFWIAMNMAMAFIFVYLAR